MARYDFDYCSPTPTSLAFARPPLRPCAMSNKIVPAMYRAVIDDVVSTIRPAFDEMGEDEEVLALLQQVRRSSRLCLTLPGPLTCAKLTIRRCRNGR